MKAIACLTSDSQSLLDTAFGNAGTAWLVCGRYDANDALAVLREGVAGTLHTNDLEDTYYCVGRCGPGGRTDIRSVHVLVIDDVGKEIDREAFDMLCPLEPSFAVESSKGSFQVGFLIPGGMDPAAFKALRETMKADPVWGKAHNISSAALYRLPQGTHTKSTRGGWRVRLDAWTGRTYTVAAILAAFVPAGVAAGGAGAGPKPFEWTLGVEALQALVDLIPNNSGIDRTKWVAVGHGIAGAGGGFEIFEGFSERWDGVVDAAETLRVWESLGESQSGGGVLRAMAEAASASGFSAWKLKWETKKVFDDGEVGAEPQPDPTPAGGGAGAVNPFQLSVAESIAAVHGRFVRFNHDSGCWHRFGGAVWEPLPKSIKLGFQLAYGWAGNAVATGALRPADAKAISKANFYDGVEAILRQKLKIRLEDFDADPWWLGTPGGTVDLKSGALHPAVAGQFVSRCTEVTPSEVEDCPRWKKFLVEICKGDAGAMLFLKQWFGYCLTGDTTEQMFLFLYGPGGNGKSVLVDTVAWLLGTYFAKPVDDLYVKKTHQRHMAEVAMLAGARMIYVNEVPIGSSWDEARLKQHTGGNRVAANFMRENTFSFMPQFKITVVGNHQPTFPGGMDPAIKRRFRMMLLDFVPKVVDRGLMETLRKEGAGILRWMINGLCDAKQGWNATGLIVPAVVDTVTDEYVAEQDVLQSWLDERVEKKPGLTASEPLHRDWIEYRNAQGLHDDLWGSMHSFVREMERRGFVRAKTKAARGFRDIVLKSKVNSTFDD